MMRCYNTWSHTYKPSSEFIWYYNVVRKKCVLACSIFKLRTNSFYKL